MLLGAGSLSSQTVSPDIRSGARSLNFLFGGFGTFGIGPSGVAGGVGFSHFASSSTAYRIGLQLVYNHSTTPWNDPVIAGNDGKTSSTGFGVGFDYLMYMEGLSSHVRPYWGPGAFFTLNSSDVKPAVANLVATGTLLETKNGNPNDGVTFGVRWVMGAEVFVYNDVSFSAEYNLNLFSLTSRADRTVSSFNLPDVTTKQGSAYQILGFGTAAAGVHLYF